LREIIGNATHYLWPMSQVFRVAPPLIYLAARNEQKRSKVRRTRGEMFHVEHFLNPAPANPLHEMAAKLFHVEQFWPRETMHAEDYV
jgi:hypothetical protein